MSPLLGILRGGLLIVAVHRPVAGFAYPDAARPCRCSSAWTTAPSTRWTGQAAQTEGGPRSKISEPKPARRQGNLTRPSASKGANLQELKEPATGAGAAPQSTSSVPSRPKPSRLEQRLARLQFGYEGKVGGVELDEKVELGRGLSKLPPTTTGPLQFLDSATTDCLQCDDQCDVSGAPCGPQPGETVPCMDTGVCPFIKFRCSRGHTWRAVQGSPSCLHCPVCQYETGLRGTRRRPRSVKIHGLTRDQPVLDLPHFQQLAAERKGACLSTEYGGIKAPLEWQCAKGHTWTSVAENVQRGHWCPHCASSRRRLTLVDMQETARQQGGLCLSKEYLGSSTKLLWQCAAGHQFWQTPNNVRRSGRGKRKASWCPDCRASSY